MPVTFSRLIVPASVVLVLFVAACQDPSGVGLELIGEEGSDPNVLVALAASIEVVEQEDFTGGFANGNSPLQSRLMVGAASDPLLGDVTAEAYLDFTPPDDVPEGFFDRTITGASIRLVRNYAYGDSTGMLPLTAFEINEDWSPVGAISDTSFAADNQLASFTVTSADTVYTLPLPTAWVAEHAEVLQSDTVAAAFNGFKVSVTESMTPGFVAGFNSAESALRVFTSQDTVDYPLSEVFTSIVREDAAPPPPDISLIRDGAGEAVRITFDIESYVDQALANATLRIAMDPAFIEEPGFARPAAERLALYGRGSNGNLVFIESADVNEDGRTFAFTSASFTVAVQSDLLGDSIFESYQIAFLESSSTLNALPLILGPAPAEGDPERRPRVALTLVPEPS
ncbi:MAG: DUF4270 family protein [Rubricoccaceae bacterium]|nr:DUF4270 family protein [Rubricoccaceae bacterium]